MNSKELFWNYHESIGFVFDLDGNLALPLNGYHYVLSKKQKLGYIGFYKNGLFDGKGLLFSPDEIIYKGDFELGRFQGIGTYYKQATENDKIIKTENDKIIKLDKYPFFYEKILNNDLGYNGEIIYEGLFYQNQFSDDWSKFDEVATVTNNSSNDSILEGTKRIKLHIDYERSNCNREEAIKYHGNKCNICGFAEINIDGLEYNSIEVHHITPVSLGPQYVDHRKDLIPLCSNCHTLVHKLMSKYNDPILILKKHLTTSSS